MQDVARVRRSAPRDPCDRPRLPIGRSPAEDPSRPVLAGGRDPRLARAAGRRLGQGQGAPARGRTGDSGPDVSTPRAQRRANDPCPTRSGVMFDARLVDNERVVLDARLLEQDRTYVDGAGAVVRVADMSAADANRALLQLYGDAERLKAAWVALLHDWVRLAGSARLMTARKMSELLVESEDEEERWLSRRPLVVALSVRTLSDLPVEPAVRSGR
jgi:hypothetical protein